MAFKFIVSLILFDVLKKRKIVLHNLNNSMKSSEEIGVSIPLSNHITWPLNRTFNHDSTNPAVFMKFAVCFDLLKMNFRLRIEIDKKCQLSIYQFIKKANLQLFENRQT